MRDSEIDDLIALAHALVDLTQSCENGLSSTSIAALIAIRRDEPLCVGDVAQIVGLTHSATVRLIDRLEKDWLVRRGRRKGREVMVETTARGKRRVAGMNDALHGSIQEVLDQLADEERGHLKSGIAAMIRVLCNGEQNQKRLYRFGGASPKG